MSLILFSVIALFVYFDVSLLKYQQPDLCRKVMRFPLWAVVFYSGAILVLSVHPAYSELLTPYVCFFLLPVYFLKRTRLVRLLRRERQRESLPQLPVNISLALDAFTVLIKWCLALLFVSILLSLWEMIFPEMLSDLSEAVLLSGCSFLIAFYLIVRVTRQYPGLSLRAVLGLEDDRPLLRNMILPALIGVVLAALSAVLIFSRDVQPSTPFNEMLETATSPGVIWGFVLVAVLLAPFFEEIIFRGFFYYVLRHNRGRVFAVLFVGLVFGALHYDQYWGDWAAVAMVTILGLALTGYRACSGSTWGSIAMHYAYNGAMTVIPIVVVFFATPSYLQYMNQYENLDFVGKQSLLLQAIDENSRYAPAYNDLAWLYAEEEHDLDRALVLIDKALAMEPESFAFRDTKAEVLYKMGRYEDALAISGDLKEKFPRSTYAREQYDKITQAADSLSGK